MRDIALKRLWHLTDKSAAEPLSPDEKEELAALQEAWYDDQERRLRAGFDPRDPDDYRY